MSKKEGKNLKEPYPSIPFVPSCLKDEGSCKSESCVLFYFLNDLDSFPHHLLVTMSPPKIMAMSSY
jgi:hypothetical protein